MYDWNHYYIDNTQIIKIISNYSYDKKNKTKNKLIINLSI